MGTKDSEGWLLNDDGRVILHAPDGVLLKLPVPGDPPGVGLQFFQLTDQGPKVLNQFHLSPSLARDLMRRMTVALDQGEDLPSGPTAH